MSGGLETTGGTFTKPQGPGYINFTGSTQTWTNTLATDFGNVVIDSQQEFNIGDDVTVSSISINTGCDIKITSGMLSITGAFTNTGTPSITGEIRFSGSGPQNVFSGGVEFDGLVIENQNASMVSFQDATVVKGDLLISSSTLRQASGDLTPSGDFTIGFSGQFAAVSGALVLISSMTVKDLTGAHNLGNVIVKSSANVNCLSGVKIDNLTVITGTFTAPSTTLMVGTSLNISTAAVFNHNGGTVATFAGGGNQTITTGGAVLNNLIVDTTGTITVNDNLVLNGHLTVSSGTFTAGDNDIIINAAVGGSSVTFASAGAFMKGAGAIILQGAAGTAIIITDGTTGQDFGVLRVSGTVTAAAGSALDVDSLRIYPGAEFKGPDSAELKVGGFFENNGIFTHRNSILVFDSTDSSQTIKTNGWPLGTLLLNNTDGPDSSVVLTDSTTIKGGLTITDGVLVQGAGNTVKLEGDLNIAAAGAITRDTGNGKFVFNGAVTQLLADETAAGQNLGDVEITGSATKVNVSSHVARFNSLSIVDGALECVATNATAKTIYIVSGNTVTLSSSLTLTGNATYYVTLKAVTENSRFYLNAADADDITLNYVKLKDCDARGSSGGVLDASVNCISLGGCYGIYFQAVVWTNAGGDNLFTTGANWNTGVVPDAIDRILLNGTTNATLRYNAATAVAGLEVSSGYKGILDFEVNALINGDVSISSGTVMVGTHTVVLTGDYDGTGRAIINGATSWVLAFDGSTAQSFTPGDDIFYEIIKASNTVNLVDDLNFRELFVEGALFSCTEGGVNIVCGSSGTINVVAGSTVSLAGSIDSFMTMKSTPAGTPLRIINSGRVALTFVNIKDSSATVTEITSQNCYDSGGNTNISYAYSIPTVTAVTPANMGQAGLISVEVTGTNFFNRSASSKVAVTLEKTGSSGISGASVTRVASNRLTLTLATLAGTTTGFWNVSVSNPDSGKGVLSNCFRVIQTISAAETSVETITTAGLVTKVEVTTGVFTTAVFVVINDDPVNNPERVTPADITAANNSLTTAAEFSLVSGTIREFVAYSAASRTAGEYIGTNRTVRIYIPYVDTEPDGIVDGTIPLVSVASLRIHHLDEAGRKWDEVTSYVDKINRQVYADINSFSVYAIIGKMAVTNLDNAYVYPNPYKDASAGHNKITFAELVDNITINIYTAAGRLVKSVPVGAVGGSYDWNLTNTGGSKINSGVYVYTITGSTGTAVMPKKGKFIVIR